MVDMGNLIKWLFVYIMEVLIVYVVICKVNIKVFIILNYLEFDKILGIV